MRIFLSLALLCVTLAATAQSGHSKRVVGLSVNADGTQILSSGVDGHAILWDDQGRIIQSFHAPVGEYRDMEPIMTRTFFYNDGEYIFVAGLLESYWGKKDTRALTTIKTGMSGGDRALALTSDNNHILMANGIDGVVILQGQGVQTGQQLRKIPEVAVSALYPVANKPEQFLTFSYTDGVKLMDVSGVAHATFPDLTERNAMAVSPNGDYFVYGNAMCNMDGKVIKRMKLGGALSDAAFSTDGQTIATASKGVIQLWNLAGKELVGINIQQEVFSLAFMPDGQRIVVGCADGSIELWSISGRKIQTFK